jgi:phosphatidylserine/phosphatidylglycerophosphate/cardiolipin synthase-like enzyme
MKNLKAILLLLSLYLLVASQIGCHEAPAPPEGISVYFNDPLAALPRMDRLQIQAGGLKGRLLELLGSAKRKIDAAVYSITDREVISALRRACARGVRLRIVTEAEEYQDQLNNLSCLELRLDENERLMHDKFMVVDDEIVWTGSANWTEGSFYFDANNALEIHDRGIAQAYEQEFSQMFRSGRFGPEKQDNNAEEFEVAGVEVELYFAPSDHPRRALLQLIAEAEERIELAMFYLTDGALSSALLDALARGVELRAVWDERGFENFSISQMDELLALGIGTVDASPGLVHDKYAIIDGEIVVSGSANWTRSGMGYNDEDMLIVHSPEVARRFAEDFERLYQDAQEYDRDPTLPPRVTRKHYNTQDVPARIEWRPHLVNKPDFYELCRARSSYGPCERIFSNIPNDHWYFIDETAEPGQFYHYRMRSSFKGEYSDWSNEYAVVAGLPVCPSSGADEECDCDDGLDNDNDGHLDCDDYGCAAATACIGPEWPTIEPAERVPGVLSAEEVERNMERYLGRWVTVRFYVTSTYDSGKVIYLDSPGDHEKNFTAVIFKRDEENFLAWGIRPELDYDHKLIEVSGRLQEYNGPEIVLRSPVQVRVVE